MEEELDFDDYPTLHLHMMIDDYEELCKEGSKQSYHRKVKEQHTEREASLYGVDPQGRFSFCFVD
ncbi:hypothetical protein G3570_01690 [Balneolaceae bacterium YR4-1]|uniref:Uncharacterized protein n=1 Tax=Halalkalibaculum roseum TaxID=2709311 RepID=A0A6M1SXN6_9BACT|nr:hypothetical protein [Halalkalibaculum roseum]NGP75327.1 hypothetical protein [Halalkalibaculum roseum]